MIIKTSYPFMKPPPSARLIRGHRLAQGLAGLWLMNENGGLQVFDSSENGNTGILQGTSPSWTSGQFGSAILLPGTDERISFGSNLKGLSNTAGTIIVWFKNTGRNSENQYIFSHRTAATNNRIYLLINDALDEGDFACGFADSAVAITSDNNIAGDGLWHQGAITWDSAGAIGYLDAVSIGTDTGTMPALDGDVYIGINPGVTLPFIGLVDLPMIYNRTLSAGELAEVYAKPFCMLERRARTALMSGYEVVGGIDYEDLLLGVSVNASVTKTDTQQMLDTGKAVGIIASISEADTQQMLDTEKAITFAASVSVTDILSGVVNYEDLLLGVSVSASVTEADIQQMLDTEKDVSIAASVSEVDTQQMVDTNKAVSFTASVTEIDTQQMVDTDLGVTVVASLNIADTQQMFDIDLSVSIAVSITETDTQQMKDLLKDVTFAVGVSETDTQQMKDLLKAITFAASCGIETEVYYDASAVVVAMYAFIILRQHTS